MRAVVAVQIALALGISPGQGFRNAGNRVVGGEGGGFSAALRRVAVLN